MDESTIKMQIRRQEEQTFLDVVKKLVPERDQQAIQNLDCELTKEFVDICLLYSKVLLQILHLKACSIFLVDILRPNKQIFYQDLKNFLMVLEVYGT